MQTLFVNLLKDPYRQANLVLAEHSIWPAALGHRAWEYVSAELALEGNRIACQLAGLDNQHPFITFLDRDAARARATCDAFVKEYKACRDSLGA